jgi:hypothetical protein
MVGYFTGAIACLAVVIAWAQWYTARSKLVLDLFNHRMEVYDGLVKALQPVWVSANADVNTVAAFNKPADRARFLFGEDVNTYLQDMRKTLAALGYCRTIMEAQTPGDAHQKAVELNSKSILKVNKFYDDFGNLAAAYMRMDHKLPPWPPWRLTNAGSLQK